MRLDVRVAAAPTPGAAWALAFGARKDGPVVVSAQQLEAALAPLPPASLRIGDELDEALHHVGLSTVGQVMGLPREVLPARFGSVLSLRLDQALGNVAEPLVPLEYVPPVAARWTSTASSRQPRGDLGGVPRADRAGDRPARAAGAGGQAGGGEFSATACRR
jgi:protein ImuB